VAATTPTVPRIASKTPGRQVSVTRQPGGCGVKRCSQEDLREQVLRSPPMMLHTLQLHVALVVTSHGIRRTQLPSEETPLTRRPASKRNQRCAWHSGGQHAIDCPERRRGYTSCPAERVGWLKPTSSSSNALRRTAVAALGAGRNNVPQPLEQVPQREAEPVQPDDLKPGLLQRVAQTGAFVSALVADKSVGRSETVRSGGDREEEHTAGAQPLAPIAHRFLVSADVLKHLERADEIEEPPHFDLRQLTKHNFTAA